MKRASIFLLALYVAAACGPKQTGEDPAPASPTVLCVRNEAPAHGNVTARAGLVRFDVLPSHMVCKRVTITGSALPLTAQAPGGGLLRPASFSAQLLQASGSNCWRWRIMGSPASALSPCDEAEEVVADTVS
jgi:hypothetical protein